ncbi:hypothetical protein ABIA16_004516 [Sinorhizobium fredii]
MNTGTSHLTANAAALLGEADKQRVRAIRSRRWLVYPRAKQVLDRLNVWWTIRAGRECLPSPYTATAEWAKQ